VSSDNENGKIRVLKGVMGEKSIPIVNKKKPTDMREDSRERRSISRKARSASGKSKTTTRSLEGRIYLIQEGVMTI